MSQLGYLQVPLCYSLQLQWKRTQSVPNSLCQLMPLLGNPNYAVNSVPSFYVMMGSLISPSPLRAVCGAAGRPEVPDSPAPAPGGKMGEAGSVCFQFAAWF